MIWRESQIAGEDGMKFQLGKLQIALSDKKDGNMSELFGEPKGVAAKRKAFLESVGAEPRALVLMKPQHGKRVIVVNGGQELRLHGDGLVTEKQGIVLGLCPADCPSAILWLPGTDWLMHLHLGRKCLDAGIIAEALWKQCPPNEYQRLQAVITPGIGPCCYRFSREVYENEVASAWPGLMPGEDGLYGVNLASQAQLLLSKFGVKDIFHWEECTVCAGRFFSHRRATLGEIEYAGRNFVACWLSL